MGCVNNFACKVEGKVKEIKKVQKEFMEIKIVERPRNEFCSSTGFDLIINGETILKNTGFLNCYEEILKRYPKFSEGKR